MTKERLTAHIKHNGKNYEAVIEHKENTILATANSLDGIKKSINEAADFHFKHTKSIYEIDYSFTKNEFSCNINNTDK